jgi:biopolymer transport protein ExbD
MRLHRTVRYNPVFFTVVPLINVLFLVILFFALSSSFLLQPGIAVTLPVSSFTLGPRRNPLMVSITATPTVVVYFQDKKMTVADFVGSLGALPATDRTLIVKADRGAPYDAVMQVTCAGLDRGFSVVLATAGPKQ